MSKLEILELAPFLCGAAPLSKGCGANRGAADQPYSLNLYVSRRGFDVNVTSPFP